MTFHEWLSDVVGKKFGSVSSFAKAADIAPSSVFYYMTGASVPNESNFVKIIVTAGGDIDDEAIEDYREARHERLESNSRKSETLCWTCQNAVPSFGKGCSWSRYFLPVEGWNAKARNHSSYHVVKCPEYIQDAANQIKTEAKDYEEDSAEEIIPQKEIRRKAHEECDKKRKVSTRRELYYQKRGLPVPTDEEIDAKKRALDAKRHREAYMMKKRRELWKELYIREIEKTETFVKDNKDG